MYRRFTTITDAEGREVCRVDARWVLIDVKQRHILRTHPEALAFPFSEEANRTLDLSIPRSTELEPAGEYTAAYSRTDRNGHLNNACYADLVCDVLLSLIHICPGSGEHSLKKQKRWNPGKWRPFPGSGKR